MATYRIEQYELYRSTYLVEANSEAEAIDKLLHFSAEVKYVDDSLHYIEIAENFGMSTDENRDLAKELSKLGRRVDEVIPSICSITVESPPREL